MDNAVLAKRVVEAAAKGISADDFAKTVSAEFSMKPSSLTAQISTLRGKIRRATTVFKFEKKEVSGQELAAKLNVDLKDVEKTDGVVKVKDGYELPYLKGSCRRGGAKFDAIALVAELTG